MSLYTFHLGQIISTVLEQVDHGGQDSNAAQTRIRDETSETDHTQKRRFRHGHRGGIEQRSHFCRNL